jgi:hypothetical protein
MLEGNKRAKSHNSAVQACGLGCAAASVVLFQAFARDFVSPHCPVGKRIGIET